MFPVFIIFDCLKMNGMESVDDYKDYTKEKKTIDILAANNLALKILGVGIVLLGVPFFLILCNSGSPTNVITHFS